MPNDVLSEEVNDALRESETYLSSDSRDQTLRNNSLRNLQIVEARLLSELEKRSTVYVQELNAEKNKKLGEIQEKEKSKKVEDAVKHQNAAQQTFEELRQVNGGAYPKNISPVLYVIPLILAGVAEWYVNYSTFAAHFIPVFAIAGTLIVAAVFAWASHLHGAYLKQLAEVLHPSLEYRHKIDRQLVLILATVFLLAAFGVVVWLRYDLVSDQLGLGSAGSGGTFGRPSASMVWSRVGPTIIMNLLIWGLGTLYSWAMHEKVPNLRESYRGLQHANNKLEKVRKPIVAAENQIKAKHDLEIKKNNVALKEYNTLLDNVRDAMKKFGAEQPQSKKTTA